MSEPHNTAMDDTSQRSGDGSPNIRIELTKESPWKQPAVYIAILACLVAYWADREARLGEYYARSKRS
jgi:hypothetical protein